MTWQMKGLTLYFTPLSITLYAWKKHSSFETGFVKLARLVNAIYSAGCDATRGLL